MKNALMILALIVAVCFIQSCVGLQRQTSADLYDLDMAIRDTSDYLNNNIRAGSRFAIINIQSSSTVFSDYIIDELIANSVSDGNFTVVDRQRINQIRAEQIFQWSDEVDDRQALEIGRLSGAEIIVSGTVSMLGSIYRLSIRALNVQSGEVHGQYNRNIPGNQAINTLARSRGNVPYDNMQSAYSAAGLTAPPAQSQGTSQADTLSGTYYYSASLYLTFSGSNFTLQGTASSGTYRVSGNSIVFSQSMYGSNTWTIVDSNTLRDPENDLWRKQAQDAAPTVPAVPTTPPVVAEPPITGISVPGNSLAEKLAWLDRSADSHNTYILEVSADENIAPYTFEYRGAINITVVLRGDGENRTVRLRSNGTMFRVTSNVTFILDNNITLQGHSQNTGPLISVSGGIFRMRTGAAITGNTNTSSYSYGGAVNVNDATFEMTGGTISGNSSVRGGGVHIYNSTFTMNNGVISGNNTSGIGGGVCVSSLSFDGSTFTMINGVISGNNASRGGGVGMISVGVQSGTFRMQGGTITGNTASEYGGGVYAGVRFNKTGGTITGHGSDPVNGNAVRDAAGNIFARRGHAVFENESRRRETSAGPAVSTSSGIWEN